MALEDLTGSSKFIDDLVNTNPDGSDAKGDGDDHIRGVKNVLLNTFPNVTGAITATQDEINKIDGFTGSTADLNVIAGADGNGVTPTEVSYLNGVTSAIQTQIDGKQASDTNLTQIAALSPTNNYFIVGDGSAWASETPAQVRASLNLEIGTDVAAASKGVTNGDSHNHSGGDGAAIPYSGLSLSNDIVAGDIADNAVTLAKISPTIGYVDQTGSGTVSGTTHKEVVDQIPQGYFRLIVTYSIVSAGGQSLVLRVSDDNGSSWITGYTQYTVPSGTTSSVSEVQITGTFDNDGTTYGTLVIEGYTGKSGSMMGLLTSKNSQAWDTGTTTFTLLHKEIFPESTGNLNAIELSKNDIGNLSYDFILWVWPD